MPPKRKKSDTTYQVWDPLISEGSSWVAPQERRNNDGITNPRPHASTRIITEYITSSLRI